MNAIEWVKSKTVTTSIDRIVISESDTDNAEEIGEYEVETSRFCGRVSYRMARELLGQCPASTEKTRFTLLVCLRSNVVEFFRTDYRKAAI